VILKSYFDGGNQADSPDYSHACIAVVSGSPTQWQRFNTAWNKVLYKHDAEFLHTTDAVSLRNEFSIDNGWNKNSVDAFILDCVRVIEKHIEISPGNPNHPIPRKGLYPVTLLIPLADWLKARQERPDLANRVAEIFASESLGFCFKRGHSLGVKRYQLYFDRGEPFYGYVYDRYNSPKARKAMPLLESIAHIGESDMRDAPALQMADLFAWCVNHNHQVVRDWHAGIHYLPWHSLHLDYARLINPHPKAIEMTRAFNLPKRKTTEAIIAKMKGNPVIQEIPENLIPKPK
jgi:hypothetical protein